MSSSANEWALLEVAVRRLLINGSKRMSGSSETGGRPGAKENELERTLLFRMKMVRSLRKLDFYQTTAAAYCKEGDFPRRNSGQSRLKALKMFNDSKCISLRLSNIVDQRREKTVGGTIRPLSISPSHPISARS